jgi:hypothetical protein
MGASFVMEPPSQALGAVVAFIADIVNFLLG